MPSALKRVLREVRADVAAARDRDPAAQGVSSFEILTSWAGVQALLAHRSPMPCWRLGCRWRRGRSPT